MNMEMEWFMSEPGLRRRKLV